MRWQRCWTRCAQRPALPSTSGEIVLGVTLAVALLLLGIGLAMRHSSRAARRRTVRVSWPGLVDEGLVHADTRTRVDIIERLQLVDSEWSRGILERARVEERDESVQAAIEAALSSNNRDRDP